MLKIKRKINVFLLFLAVISLLAFALSFNSVKTYADEDPLDEISLTMVPGASIRLDEHSGIRFAGRLSSDDYDAISTYYDDISYGVFIMPKAYVTKFGGLTYENLFGENAVYTWQGDTKTVDVDSKTILHMETLPYYDSDVYGCYLLRGSIASVLTQNLNLEFVGTAYIKATKGGETSYKIADIDGDGRSVVLVAQKAIATNIYTGENLELLNGFINNYINYYEETHSGESPQVDYTVNIYKDGVLDSTTVKQAALNSRVVEEPAEILDGYVLNKNYSYEGVALAQGNLVINVYYNSVNLWNKTFAQSGNVTVDTVNSVATVTGGTNDLENRLTTTVSGLKQSATVRMEFAPSSGNHQAGLLFLDGTNYFKVMWTYENGYNYVIISPDADPTTPNLINIAASDRAQAGTGNTIYIKYLRNGSSIAFFCSTDGTNFNMIGGMHQLLGNLADAENLTVGLFASKWGADSIDAYFKGFEEVNDEILLTLIAPENATFTVTQNGNALSVFNAGTNFYYALAEKDGADIDIFVEKAGFVSLMTTVTDTSTDYTNTFNMAGTTFEAGNWNFEPADEGTYNISSDKTVMTQSASTSATNDWAVSAYKTISGTEWQVQMKVTKTSSFDSAAEQRIGFMIGDVANKYKATYLKLVNNFDKTNGHLGLWASEVGQGPTITAAVADNVYGTTVGGLTQGTDFYIRIVRHGNVINLFCSTDGSNWTQVGGDHVLIDENDSYNLFISTNNKNSTSSFSATYSEYTEIHTI